jgi:hypothetical protein
LILELLTPLCFSVFAVANVGQNFLPTNKKSKKIAVFSLTFSKHTMIEEHCHFIFFAHTPKQK